MLSVVLNCILVILFNYFFACINGDCTYSTHLNKTSPAGHERLIGLLNKRYFVEDVDYTYYIGICTSAKIGVAADVGILQEANNDKSKTFVVGKIDSSAITSGRNWVLLEYANGDDYKTHCEKEARRGAIMFTCNEQLTGRPEIRVLGENTDKISNCYYLFEIAHSSVCVKVVVNKPLSVGSILVISFCVIITLYIIIGFLIQRFRGAKGMEQIPNYSAWQECGNLVADGCDFVFRSRPKATNHLYPPMAGQPRQTLQPDDRHLIDDDDNDDHMLPM